MKMTDKINQAHLEQLRNWLEQQGFRFGTNPARDQTNNCTWLAWRRSSLPAKDCNCYGAGVQVVITPYSYVQAGRVWESVEIDITGKRDDTWYKLQAYGLLPTEVMERLATIEATLVNAWNSLSPTENTTMQKGEES